MTKFRVGDKVKISPEGEEWFSDSLSNPYNTTGKVYELYDGYDNGDIHYTVRVKWDNDYYNSYNVRHLKKVEPMTKQRGTPEELNPKVGEKFLCIRNPNYHSQEGKVYTCEHDGKKLILKCNMDFWVNVETYSEYIFERVDEVKYEDKWTLNEGQPIPPEADTLEKDGSVVAYRMPIREPHVGDWVFFCHLGSWTTERYAIVGEFEHWGKKGFVIDHAGYKVKTRSQVKL